MARILVVGTQPAERGGLALVMEFAGHQCDEAGSLQEAMALLKKSRYDLVLADASLGDSNPQQVEDKLRGAFPEVGVIVLAEETAIPSTSDEVITLPYSPVKHLAPQFAPIRKREIFLTLLPERESAELLKEIPETPGMLNKLAVLYHSQEKYAAAERLYKRALELTEKKAGERRGEAASVLNNLATLYHDQKRYDDAEPLYKKSLALVEKLYGPNHPKVARRLSNLVELYRAQGKEKAAVPYLERLRKIDIRPGA